jgi:hypothetical protein
VGGPLVVLNSAGVDQFFMNNSETPWGLFINNDLAATNTSLWGSSTDIRSSKIGTRPLGPDLSHWDPGTPNAAFALLGDNGADTVNVADTTVGGAVDLKVLHNGNNAVTLARTSMASLWLATGTGNDTVVLDTVTIPVQVDMRLGWGADHLSILGLSQLPNPLLGFLVIDGQGGVDTYHQDAGVLPSVLPVLNFEVII